MILLKKLLAVGTMVLTISATSVMAFGATTYKTPAEIVAGLTNKTVQEVITESMQTGKTFGTIANKTGLLDKFQAENLEIKKAILNEQVANGYLTQVQADSMIANIQTNQTICGGYNMGYGCGMGYYDYR